MIIRKLEIEISSCMREYGVEIKTMAEGIPSDDLCGIQGIV